MNIDGKYSTLATKPATGCVTLLAKKLAAGCVAHRCLQNRLSSFDWLLNLQPVT